MRIVLFALIVAAVFATGFKSYHEDGQIKFNMDVHYDSPVGIYLEGLVDPQMETNNKIQAFVKLANQYIPILESLGGQEGGLKYERIWHYSFAGVNIDVYWYFQLIVGWKVKPGSYSTNFYEVTYTPFVWGGTYGRVNGTTWPAVGSAGTGLQYVHAYSPIGVTLYKEGKACFGSTYTVQPVMLKTDINLRLNECWDEIIDEIIGGIPIHLTCNYTAAQNFTLFNVNFTNAYTGDLIPQICFNF
jgi:hypothetical protein